MITELKPTNLIAVEFPSESGFFSVDMWSKWMISYDPDLNTEEGNFGYFNVGYKFKIIGEVTKDRIGFKQNDLPTTLLCKQQADELLNHNDKIDFYKLLEANGLYFANIYGEEPNHIDYKYEKYKGEFHFKSDFDKNVYVDKYEAWQSFEDKVIKGKLLIIQKIENTTT